MPCVLSTTTLRDEKEIWSNIKKLENIMTMIVAIGFFLYLKLKTDVIMLKNASVFTTKF